MAEDQTKICRFTGCREPRAEGAPFCVDHWAGHQARVAYEAQLAEAARVSEQMRATRAVRASAAKADQGERITRRRVRGEWACTAEGPPSWEDLGEHQAHEKIPLFTIACALRAALDRSEAELARVRQLLSPSPGR
jgi:hypothetical protein